MERTPIIYERIEEGAREVGLLLVALAPLDALLTPSGTALGLRALILVMLGVCLFMAALWHERRRLNA